MTSRARRDFDAWVNGAYSELLKFGRRYTPDSGDLLHHVYLRVVRQDLEKVMRNPMAYFKKAMFFEATRGNFKKVYAQELTILCEIPDSSVGLDEALDREQLEIFTDRLSWFDQIVFRLWLSGQNISELSRESGIALETLHTSLYRTKKKIKDAFSTIKR